MLLHKVTLQAKAITLRQASLQTKAALTLQSKEDMLHRHPLSPKDLP